MTKRPLRVHICNERLISRFGVDRLLLLCGKGLQSRKIDITYWCLRYDPTVLTTFGGQVQLLDVPNGLDVRQTESKVTGLMMEAWFESKPDVIVVGGWPFFELAARAPSVGVKSVFIDAGAVPHDGLEGNSLWPQYEVRRAREAFLPYISKVLPISDFVCDSQTLPDRGSRKGVRTIRLCADHLSSLSYGEKLEDWEIRILNRLTDLARQGQKLILNLGRFEATGYKQSPLFFDLLRGLRKNGLMVVGLILSDEHEIAIPTDLRDFVVLLGKPSDAALRSVMHRAHLGVSMSSWEGFNLPLVEMQAEYKPALAFAIGAHPEVVAHPI